MTTIYLPEDVAKDEGFRSHAYPDPLTGSEPWTCGYGCTGPDVGPETVWTQAQAYQRLMEKLNEAKQELDARMPWWRRLSDPRQDVLANMAYNMGLPRLLGFKKALAAMQLEDWPTVAAEMLSSAWAQQVGQRAIRLARQMHDGVRIAS